MRLRVVVHLHILVRKAALERRDEISAVPDIRIQSSKQVLRRRVEGRRDDHPVAVHVRGRGLRRKEIALDVHFIERIVEETYDIVVGELPRTLRRRVDPEILERRQRLIAHEDGRLVVLLQVDEMAPEALKVRADRLALAVNGIFREVVA